ncbi:spore gernimation protein [Micromonospora endolithica]|uniref:Spore gernimation protein n=1 Tax=Micromonospora endolithica TaxID=230091 RepID=A0A3A9ZTA6_9ACTN|nr:spore gernimation protein [Micromonospora endolithica]
MLALLAGCAPDRAGSLGPAPTAAPPTAASPPASSSAPPPAATAPSRTAARATPPAPPTAGPSPSRPGPVTIELWYVRDGRITPTRRTRPATVATSALALTELARGPTAAEAAAGLATFLPAGVGVTRITDGVAVVGTVPVDDDRARRLAEAQVVWTLTQFATVRSVRFGAGPAVGRAGYADLLPPIVVTAPAIGQRVGTPVTVTGTADVFEATVSVRVLDAAGREVGTAFTTATCGTGCRGAFRVAVGYRVGREQPGTVEAYEVSPADGSRTKLVSVPVVLGG